VTTELLEQFANYAHITVLCVIFPGEILAEQ
jgi:hypothetical protein